MLSKIKFTLFILLSVSISACAATAVKPENVQQLDIRNLNVINSSQFSGGQPTLEQLDGLQRAGVKNIINLRPVKEQKFDEAQAAKKLGINYVSIPVAGKAAINELNAKKLADALKLIGAQPVFVHCASGNRVGALEALNEFNANGGDIDAAIAKGKQWGLTRLEKVVKLKLEKMESAK